METMYSILSELQVDACHSASSLCLNIITSTCFCFLLLCDALIFFFALCNFVSLSKVIYCCACFPHPYRLDELHHDIVLLLRPPQLWSMAKQIPQSGPLAPSCVGERFQVNV